MERVRWVVPPAWLHRLTGRLLSRELVLWREIARSRVERVMTYNAVPHLLLASWPARLFRRKLDVHLISGQLDLDFAHRPEVMVNRVVRRLSRPGWIQAWARRIAFRQCDRLFVPGVRAREFLARMGVDSRRIVNIHSAVDPEVYRPGNGPRDIDVLIIANLQTRKRPELTIRILERVLQARPESTFVWIGDGHLRDEVHRMVAASPIARATRMVGHTDDVLSFDQRAKVYLLNSVSEGLSCATMEAMAAGVVPVTSDVGDMAEVVRTGETGELIADIDDPDAFARAVLGLLADDTRRARLAAAARDLIVREHSFAAVSRAWRCLEG
jgi:glycosyltransferase involved in cell wall biosynthesis